MKRRHADQKWGAGGPQQVAGGLKQMRCALVPTRPHDTGRIGLSPAAWDPDLSSA